MLKYWVGTQIREICMFQKNALNQFHTVTAIPLLVFGLSGSMNFKFGKQIDSGRYKSTQGK